MCERGGGGEMVRKQEEGSVEEFWRRARSELHDENEVSKVVPQKSR